ncbi:MAG: hypothetical protein H0X33_02670 [Taibaiella sp.]|nr:hypothetical protein [Taibaiella sp.]
MKKIYSIGLLALMFASCKPNLSTTAPGKGTADFSVYVAVGNSLTAGYADNSLYRAGQQNSYPLRLSEQFRLVGGGNFVQPLLPSTAGFPYPRLVLGLSTSCNGSVSLGPVFSFDSSSVGNGANISSQGPFNNVGVPGIRCVDYLQQGYGYVNPYASRFYSNPIGETPLDEALKLPATFYTVWLGANDVLGYATGGGVGNPTPFVPRPEDITPTGLFQTIYDSVINALFAHGAKGVVVNIPDVTAIPFFTTVPHNALVLRQGQADSLNAGYAHAGIFFLNFTKGPNNFVIADPTATYGFRQMYDDELVLLTIPQDSIICYGWGSQVPIPSKYILTRTEIANVRSATSAYNNIIQDAASKHNLGYVDINNYLRTISTGIQYNGVKYNAQFVTGGAFSLDGVHLTPRGYALVANYIISVINGKYGSTVPSVDVNKYQGVQFP